jgi:hypothetical protein
LTVSITDFTVFASVHAFAVVEESLDIIFDQSSEQDTVRLVLSLLLHDYKKILQTGNREGSCIQQSFL